VITSGQGRRDAATLRYPGAHLMSTYCRVSVTPAAVKISVHGRIKEQNPLYQDPIFRQFFDLPQQFEREVQAHVHQFMRF
jgi:hypothetical protein